MAQLVEQLTLNQWVPGSSPGGCTSHAEVAELADALDSKSSLAQTKWGFDSPLRHKRILVALINVPRYTTKCFSRVWCVLWG